MKVWMVTICCRDDIADFSLRETMELVLEGGFPCASFEAAKRHAEAQMRVSMDTDDDGADALIVLPEWEQRDNVHMLVAWEGALVCHVWEVEVFE